MRHVTYYVTIASKFATRGSAPRSEVRTHYCYAPAAPKDWTGARAASGADAIGAWRSPPRCCVDSAFRAPALRATHGPAGQPGRWRDLAIERRHDPGSPTISSLDRPKTRCLAQSVRAPRPGAEWPKPGFGFEDRSNARRAGGCRPRRRTGLAGWPAQRPLRRFPKAGLASARAKRPAESGATSRP